MVREAAGPPPPTRAPAERPRGGGLFNTLGTTTFSGGLISGNQAIGGAGGSGSSGTGGIGGDAQGGGVYSVGGFIFVFNNDGTFSETLVIASLNASDVTLLGNLAQGGRGGAGGGTGGTGAGGAVYNESASTLSISVSLLSLNTAEGGAGGSDGGSGGAGFGGAIDSAGPNDLDSPALPGAILSLTNTVVVANLAQGGDAVEGGTDGQGIGGGLYLATGSASTLTATIVAANLASTSNDNIFGSFTSN